ncbi:hypothetical protein [Streptomyces sp. NPDC006463]|uniref:hypothetical protein n=1 Tax=Streptomyces sp. NPDC006463 TaxID=3364746 RepID=UPI00369ACED6
MTSSSLSRRGLLAAAGAAGAAGLLGAAAGSASATPSGRGPAALVIHDARVFSGSGTGRPAEAVAVGRDGRILATGENAALRRFVGRDTETVDAGGNTVMSGIHDGHVHPLGAADRSLRPSLGGAETTVEELREILGGFLADSGGAAAEPDRWSGGAGPGCDPLSGGRHQRYRGADDPGRRPGGARRAVRGGPGGFGAGRAGGIRAAPGLVRGGARRTPPGVRVRRQGLSRARAGAGAGPGSGSGAGRGRARGRAVSGGGRAAGPRS